MAQQTSVNRQVRSPKRAKGVFKECRHLWNKCSCPWLGRWQARGIRRLNLAKWLNASALTRRQAEDAIEAMREAVRADTFNPIGRGVPLGASAQRFGTLCDLYKTTIEQGERRGSSTYYLLSRFKTAVVSGIRFGDTDVATLERRHDLIEAWLDELALEHGWSNRTWNEHYAFGKSMFNWAIRKGHVLVNPFIRIDPRKTDTTKRETRVTPEQEQALFDALPRLTLEDERERPTKRKGVRGKMRHAPISIRPDAPREMERRLVGAIDGGMRRGEMQLVQVSWIDYRPLVIDGDEQIECIRINIPGTLEVAQLPAQLKRVAQARQYSKWIVTKSGQPRTVFAATERFKRALESRRFLGPKTYVFGTEDGAFVRDFDRSWKRLFGYAGIAPGRIGLTWHDLRHEYISFLIDAGWKVEDVQAAVGHANIQTTLSYYRMSDQRLASIAASLRQRKKIT